VATAKINFEEQSLVVDTKQRSQDDKEDRLTSQAGWQACLLCSEPVCFVLCPLLELALPSGFYAN
jgi:Fe-S-cluster-containing dehydrogenase component